MADVKIDLKALSADFIVSLKACQAQLGQVISQSNITSAALSKLNTVASLTGKGLTSVGTSAVSTGASITRMALSIALATVSLDRLFGLLQRAPGTIKDLFVEGVQNIDAFRRGTIGAAAAITNIADKSVTAGQTYEQIFHTNLKATEQTFIELEKLSARYFARAIDLQLAYNTFAQRGIIIRRSELPLLAQLTDQILLLTQGQQSTIQVQEEIRSLLSGNLRTTAQLNQLLKAYGVDAKEIGAQIRATGSLNPLENILRGAQAATNEIQKTFQATYNGLEVAIKQIGRLGLDQFYAQLVGSVQRFTDFLQNNKADIVGLLSAIGKGASTIVEDVRKAVEQISGFDKKASGSQDGFINFIAVVQTSIQLMIRTIHVLINLFTELPALFADVGRAIDLAFTPQQKVKDLKASLFTIEDAIKQQKARVHDIATGDASGPEFADTFIKATKALKDSEDAAKDVRKQLGYVEAPLTSIYEGVKDVIGGMGGLKEAAKTLGIDKEFTEAGKVVDTLRKKIERATEPLSSFSFAKQLKVNTQEALGASIVGKEIAVQKLNEPRADEAPTTRPFVPDPKLVTSIEHAEKTLLAAADRANRAIRSAVQTQVSGQIDVQLEALKRSFTLTEQGFTHIGDRVVGLRSVVQDTVQFMTGKLQAFVTGQKTDFTELARTVAKTYGDISADLLDNLQAQYTTARRGIQTFIDRVHETSLELRKTEVEPHLDKAAVAVTDRNTDFNVAVIAAEKILQAEKDKLAVAIEEKDVRKIADAEAAVAAEQYKHAETIRHALLAAGLQTRLQETELQIAAAQQTKIDAQELNAVAAENTKLEKEKLRVLQGQEIIIGKILQSNVDLIQKTQDAVVAAKSKFTRTDIQQGQAEIEKIKLGFAIDIGKAEANLSVARKNVQDQTFDFTTSQDSPRDFNFGKGPSKESLATVDKAQGAVTALNDLQKTAVDAQQAFVNLRVSISAINTAVESTINGLADALTGSFEGKKTDFARIFKGVADQLFKDSLKGLVQSAQTALTGSNGIFTKLFASIPGDMAKTLGPAFLAGFALLASFVIGQLLQGNNSSATAGNPKVGIQSSEQIRGLIGGETQIPIGLVGASLQDALVPTNLLLRRIASAVEGVSFGGLTSAQIEAVVERGVRDAIQVQPV